MNYSADSDEDECRTMPCHPQAECHNKPGSFECKCPKGFEGDGVKSCMNPLENGCKDMMQTCGRTEHTACLSVRLFDGSLGSICECEPNYRFNNVTQQCEDIDECAENRHNCDPASSQCINEDGGFKCECYEGYEGTGGVCVDIDECERGVAGCHSMAMCINQPGSCGCKCVNGFTGDGTQCNAMKRETNNTCTPEWERLCKKENKTCHLDQDDVPECGSCLDGHEPVNGTCQRELEESHNGGNCADPAKNNCDVNAECIDVRPGRHFCTCKVGYIGDGMRCDGPNCHLDPQLCHANAECMVDGNCKCRHGYKGDGIESCIEITNASSTITTIISTTTTTLRTSSTTAISTGVITEIDENENFTTSTVKPSSSSSSIFPLTTDHDRNHSTITTTTSIRPSTSVSSTTPSLVHESTSTKSTTPTVTDHPSSVDPESGIPLITLTSTSNLSSDAAKQTTTTTTIVTTNQPHGIHSATDKSFLTVTPSRNQIEVTSSMIVFSKSSAKPLIIDLPQDSTEAPIPPEEGLFSSRTFQRESTTLHGPTSSSVSTTVTDTTSNTTVTTNHTKLTVRVFPFEAIQSTSPPTTEARIESGGLETTASEESATSPAIHRLFPTPKELTSNEVTESTDNATSGPTSPFGMEGSGEEDLTTSEPHEESTTSEEDSSSPTTYTAASSPESTATTELSTSPNGEITTTAETVFPTIANISKMPEESEEIATSTVLSTEGETLESATSTGESLVTKGELPMPPASEFTDEAPETSTFVMDTSAVSVGRHGASSSSPVEALPAHSSTTSIPPEGPESTDKLAVTLTTEGVEITSASPATPEDSHSTGSEEPLQATTSQTDVNSSEEPTTGIADSRPTPASTEVLTVATAGFTDEAEFSTKEVETSVSFTRAHRGSSTTTTELPVAHSSSTTPPPTEVPIQTIPTVASSIIVVLEPLSTPLSLTRGFTESEDASPTAATTPLDVNTTEESNSGIPRDSFGSTVLAVEVGPKDSNTTSEPTVTSSIISVVTSSESAPETSE
ncbi:hypothetical protein GCK32_013870, partial [Trichostrongylus colubriformis]